MQFGTIVNVSDGLIEAVDNFIDHDEIHPKHLTKLSADQRLDTHYGLFIFWAISCVGCAMGIWIVMAEKMQDFGLNHG
jgi:hypothetical protein